MDEEPRRGGGPLGHCPDARSAPAGISAPANVLLESADTGAACGLVLSLERPGHEPPRHRHQQEDEACYVLEGKLLYFVGEHQIEAQSGSAIFLPRGLEHGFRVLTPQARVLTVYAPGGFEGLLRELGSMAGNGLTDYEMERLIATAARFGCEITGAPP